MQRLYTVIQPLLTWLNSEADPHLNPVGLQYNKLIIAEELRLELGIKFHPLSETARTSSKVSLASSSSNGITPIKRASRALASWALEITFS